MNEQGSTASRRILVVDDNQDSAHVVATYFRMLDHEVAEAYDGPSAIDLAREFRPEFVFLDLVMPGMDGYAVANQLRQQERGRNQRAIIVALSGQDAPAFREATAEGGFDSHLAKPARPEQLLSLLALN